MKLAVLYRNASRELLLPAAERQLLQKLLRELAINTVSSHLAWNLKQDFITLWFISAGSLKIPGQITAWFINQLPFELNTDEQQMLYL